MSKTYVLDTSVLMHDSKSFLSFEENTVIIPITVLEELDNLKSKEGMKGASARSAIKELANYLDSGDNGNIKFCDVEEKGATNDDKIISCAAEKNGILVTRDINCRVKAFGKGVEVQYYKKHTVDIEDECLIELECSNSIIDTVYKEGKIEADTNLFERQPVILKNGNKSCLCIHKSGNLYLIKQPNLSYIQPKDVKQTFALNYLMDDNVPLCILEGRAGTGKTLLSLAAGLENIRLDKQHRILIAKPLVAVGGESSGYLPGPQPLYCKVLTPSGWRTMGSLKAGDYVIGRYGKPVKIKRVLDQGVKPVYKIDTELGVTFACDDHLWVTKTLNELKHNRAYKLRNTNELRNTLFASKQPGPQLNHHLPINSSVEFESDDRLPFPAYVLGVLLGAGKFNKEIAFLSTDDVMVRRVRKLLNEYRSDINIRLVECNNSVYELVSNKASKPKSKPVLVTNIETGEVVRYNSPSEAASIEGVSTQTIYKRCRDNLTIKGYSYSYDDIRLCDIDLLHNLMLSIGLYNKEHKDKFIPDIYKYTTFKNRLDLLRGLMDGKGDIIDNTGRCFFATPSKQLAEDVAELVKSLGVKAMCFDSGEGFNVMIDRFPTDIIPFYTGFKSSVIIKMNLERPNVPKQYNRIKNIVFDSYQEVRCLSLDSDDNLYITDNYIITHNSLEEKLEPWLGCIYDNLSYLGYSDSSSHIFIDNIIEPMSIEHIRGRSLRDSFVIVEETQNLNWDVLKTILTRAGDNTKVVVCGDLTQIDSIYIDKGSSGLSKLIKSSLDSDLVGYIKLDKCVRSKLADFIDSIED